MSLSVAERLDLVADYDFRRLHPSVRFGTASDRYGGWLGQIYSDYWKPDIKTRTKKLGNERFEEQTLPIGSVEEYFQHFSVLELDFTFYNPLMKEDGSPTPNLFVLEQYADAAPKGSRFLLKAPQAFFARHLRRGPGRYDENPTYLSASGYVARFHEPALKVLGDRLQGIIFEQEYQRVADSPAPEENIADLDGFFREVPHDVPLHIELRSAHQLVPPYFAWLESVGIGFVFSHWTWLPALRDQWQRTDGRFTSAHREVVVRLLTPRNVPYAKAYAQAHPFTDALPEIAESAAGRQMIDDTTALAYQAIQQDATLNVIANNRAWGNSPKLAQAIAHRFLGVADKRGA